MKFRMLFVAAAMLVCSMVAFGQGFSVALFGGFNEDQSIVNPLTNHCGGNPESDYIPDGVTCQIRQDVNNNGPTDDDPAATVGGGVGQVNYNTFTMNGCGQVGLCGLFSTTTNFVSNGVVPANNRWWVRVVGTHAILRSTVFSPTAGPNNIYLSQWGCEVLTPACVPTPGPIVVAGAAPQYRCVTVCAGSQTEVIVIGCGPQQPPFVGVTDGCTGACQSSCQPGHATLQLLGFGADGAWHYTLVGGSDGCVCLGWDGCPPPPCQGDGTVTLTGDRAHPGSLPSYLCAQVAPNQPLVIRICSADGAPLDPTKRPFVTIASGCFYLRPGCDNDCTPGSTVPMGPIPPAAWGYVGGCWVFTVLGEQCGCVCIGLDGYEAAELSSFTAIARSASVEVAFATSSESDLDHFEVYRALKGHEEATLVRSFNATNTSTEHTYNFVDSDLRNGTTYVYSLRSVDVSSNRSDVLGTVEATPTFEAAVVTEYAVYQNYPNPFNPTTQITFDVLEDNNVSLTVFNATGQEVATVVNGAYAAGRHTVTFDAANLTSGLYFYTVKMGDKFTATKKMLLVK